MTRFVPLLAMVLLCAAPAHADVTVTQTITIEGPMAQMMTGGAPRMVTHIKGLQSRTNVEVMNQTIATITDLATQQVIFLNGATRTAQVVMPGTRPAPGAPPVTMPKIAMSFKSTGRTQEIEGARCEEHAFTMTMNMAEAGASGQMPPEALAAMKDVRMAMSGSVWIATSGPGVADYVRFQKLATDANMVAALTGMQPGGQPGGLEQLIAASSAAPGLPYLSEMTMTFEGSGKMVEMMKQMGPIKMTQRTTAVSTDALSDDLFQVPGDYKMVTQ